VLYFQEALGLEPLPWQKNFLTALERDDRVAAKSAHGVGKSTTLAGAALWFISTRFPCKVPVTAPTLHQLEDVFWAELAALFNRMPVPLRSQFELTQERLYMKARPKEAFVVARTARKEQPEALQGFHSEHLLFLIDEASGIPDAVFEVAEGALSTPGAKVGMGANPTRTSGYFFDTFHKSRSLWTTMTVSGWDLQGTPLWNAKMEENLRIRYGADSNAYRIRWLGEFPTGEDDAVIPLHLVESSIARDIGGYQDAAVVWGLDVARFGDDRSVLCKRQGRKVLEKLQTWRDKDSTQLAGLVTAEYRATPHNKRPREIFVDVIGVGAGVCDRLRENGLPAYAVNVAESPAMRDKYFRLRDELWWTAREWFEERGGSLPDDDELVAELTTPKYEILGSGKVRVESKDDVKRRLLEKKSPDKADAFILTFASQRTNGRVDADLNIEDAGYYL
jgi:phage terminase large subunit